MPLVGTLQAGERSVKWDAGAGEMGFLPVVDSREGNIKVGQCESCNVRGWGLLLLLFSKGICRPTPSESGRCANLKKNAFMAVAVVISIGSLPVVRTG